MPDDAANAPPAGAGRLILIVEDDDDLREALAESLEDSGYEVVTAVNGKEGLRQLRVLRPAAVVLDLVMPQMDGWEFRLAQKHDPSLCTIPVVAISASHSAMAATIDADLYLEKPFRAGDIVGAIETVLRAQAHTREVVTHAQTERLVALGTLAAGVAHEINNPLTYVMLNLSGMKKHLATIDSEPHRATLERIDRMLREATEGSERIRGIVQGIRLFSRADERAPAPVDVRMCVDAAVRLVMNDLRMRARLVTDYDTVPLVKADDSRLGQVFLNLIANAIQATPEGDPSAHEIRIGTHTDDVGRAVTEITDTGVGIPVHLVTRIFEPFFTTKPLGQGTGLGLSISHGIVRTLGGEIEVTSKVGHGSTFRVSIPAMDNAPRIEAEAAPEPPPSGRLRILVIDDELAVCTALAEAIGDEHDVVEANSSAEALDRITANQAYDVILCDVQMPGMSGIELYRCLRSVWPQMNATVILMTGGTLPPALQELLADRHVTVVEKPLSLPHLRRLISMASQNHA